MSDKIVTISVKHQDLYAAIMKCSSVVSGKHPIIKFINVKFDSKLKSLYLYATDGVMSLICSVKVVKVPLIVEDFNILADPKLLMQILPSITSDVVTIECTPKTFNFVIKGTGNEYGCNSQDPEDYPNFLVSDDAEDIGLKVPSGYFKRMLSNVREAINPNHTMKVITGAYFEYENNENSEDCKLYTVGMQDSSLIFTHSHIKLGEKSFSCIIPHNIISVIMKVVDESDDIRIKLVKEKEGESEVTKYMFFQSMKYEIGFTPFSDDEEYPEFDELVPGTVRSPKENDDIAKISVPIEKFKEAINYAKPLADKEHGIVHFEYKPGKEEDGHIMSGTIYISSESDKGYAKVSPVEVKNIKGANKVFKTNLVSSDVIGLMNVITGNEFSMSFLNEDPTMPIRMDSGTIGSSVVSGGIVNPVDLETDE